MKYQRLALVATGLALAAMVYLMAMGGAAGDSHTEHLEVAAAPGILADSAQDAGGVPGTTPRASAEHSHPTGIEGPSASDPGTAGEPTTAQQSVAAAPGAQGTVAAIATDPANRRQVGLAEAAGESVDVAADPAAQVPTAGSTSPFIDPDAAGVNDGSKKQAADVPLQVAPPVPPQDLLPNAAQASGCVIGYGRGAVCLPQTPPSHAGHGQFGLQDQSVYWTCAEVRYLLPDGIVVDSPNGDRLGLDSNADGTACGVGDS